MMPLVIKGIFSDAMVEERRWKVERSVKGPVVNETAICR